jgi:HSP20 family protein
LTSKQPKKPLGTPFEQKQSNKHSCLINTCIIKIGDIKMALVRFTNSKNQGVNQWVNDFFAPFATDSFLADRTIARVPAVNISETDEAYQIELAAPGLEKSDFKVHIDQDVLTITVEKSTQNTQSTQKYNKKEFSYTSFTRSFTLPENAEQNDIVAKYQDGILHLQIAKKVMVKPETKEIVIQ